MNSYDVMVVGGGSAGVAAAVGAARTGRHVLLIERGPCLGGAATLRGVVTYCGLYTREDARQVVHGVAGEVLDRLRGRGAVSAPTRITGVAVVFDPEAVKHELDALCAEAGVEVLLDSMVVGARADDGCITSVTVADHQGRRELCADSYVDASGEADLAARAGAALRYGNDGWVQSGTLAVRLGGVGPETDLHDPRLGAGLVARMPLSGDIVTYLIDEAYDATDAADTSRATRRARDRAWHLLEKVRTLPGAGSAHIVTTGPELGTRESRHVTTRRVLTAGELIDPAPFGTDTVALGAWPMEYHREPGRPSEWEFIGGSGVYGIPLDAMRSASHDNLWVAGRCVDGDRGAGASLRAMGTAFATGHAAGVGAALGPDTPTVVNELQRQGAQLPDVD